MNRKNTTTKIVFLIFLSLLNFNLIHSQTNKASIFGELFGASTTFGIHFDSRFNSETNWGGRLGVGFTESKSQDFFKSAPERTRGWSFPIAVNYLLGKNGHYAEIGIGVSYGLYNCKYHDKVGHEIEESKSGSFGFLDLGYRYQRENGIVIRIGISPGVALDMYDEDGITEHGVDRAAVVYPYISFGFNL